MRVIPLTTREKPNSSPHVCEWPYTSLKKLMIVKSGTYTQIINTKNLDNTLFSANFN